MAAVVWMTVWVLCLHAVLMCLIADYALAARGEQSVSAWLRLNPACYWLPLSALLVGLAYLTFHLFRR